MVVYPDSDIDTPLSLSLFPNLAEEVGARPEVELLFSVARRAAARAAVAERAGELVERGLDWARFLKLCERHGLTQLAYRFLSENFARRLAEGELEPFRQKYNSNAARNLLLARELCGIVERLEADGVNAIAYKGPAQAAEVYGDLRLRSFVDLDILVRRRDVPKARQLLRACGYLPRLSLTPSQEEALARSECDEVFVGGDGKIYVELHWTVVPPYFSFPLDTESLFARAKEIELGGARVRAPSPEDLLLIVCVNGAKDLWRKLEAVCCVARLAGREGLRWSSLLEEAERLRARRMLYLGLALAHGLLGAHLPHEVLSKIESEPGLGALAREALRYILPSQSSPGVGAKTLFRLRARERWGDRALYCLRRAVTPTYEDFIALNLPRGLTPAYYLLRPLRLLKGSFIGPRSRVL